jgi:hypothetical protein
MHEHPYRHQPFTYFLGTIESELSHYSLCNLTSGNSLGVCAVCPTEGHAPRWGDPFFWYFMKETNQPWSTKYAERTGYGD